MFVHLFEPGRIGTMAVRNRILMAPMVRNYAAADGASTERYEAHIARVARGGVGAIILEAAFVSPEGRGFVNQLGLHDDLVLPGLRRLADAAHGHGSKIGIQLYHAGRQTVSAVSGYQPVAPSPAPCPIGQELPHQLSIEEIRTIVERYADAAGRAAAAGLDFVEIHGAHGYLITQFLSGFSNHRDDAYGGRLENRMRFLVEVYEAVRDRVGPEFPITVRLSAEEYTPGGVTLAETLETARLLESLGADALHISACSYGSYATGKMISPMSVPDAPLARLAEAVKASVTIPVIAVDKVRTPELAEDLIAYGVADFIALGRPLLADPDWPMKAQAGDLAGINKCIACNEGCISRLFEQKDAWCLVNPATGREAVFEEAEATAARRVVVVGGGPAGMTAAIHARRRGHAVTLFEQRQRLGGQLYAAAAAPYRPGWDDLRRHLRLQLARSGAEVRSGASADAALIRSCEPDVVIIATGARPRLPSWPTYAGVQVWTTMDVLDRGVTLLGPVVVAGGGCAGAQTAELLAERGLQVTLVEPGQEIAADAPIDERTLLAARLKRLGVSILRGHQVVEAGDEAVVVESGPHLVNIPARSLVLCHGSTSVDDLSAALKDLGIQAIKAGDCVRPRQAIEAILEGALAGWTLGEDGVAPVAAGHPVESAVG